MRVRRLRWLILASAPALCSPSLLADAPVEGVLVTRESTTVVRGVAAPGVVVSLTDEFRMLTVKRADGSGAYEFVGVRLKEGRNRLQLRFTEAHGDSREAVREVVCDTVPPPLSVTGPLPDSLTSSPTPEVRGVTERGTSVVVVAGTVATGPVTTDPTGAFRAQLPRLKDGRHDIAVVASDPAGNESVERRRIEIDTAPPAVRIVSPDTGMLTRRSRFGVRQGRAHPVSVNVVIECEPRCIVELLVNNEGRGSTDAGTDGKAHFLNVALPVTQVWLGARATDAAGNVGRARQVWLGQPRF